MEEGMSWLSPSPVLIAEAVVLESKVLAAFS